MDTVAIIVGGIVVLGLGLGLGITGMVLLARTRQPGLSLYRVGTTLLSTTQLDHLVVLGLLTAEDRNILVNARNAGATAAGFNGALGALTARVGSLEGDRDAINGRLDRVENDVAAVRGDQGLLRDDHNALRRDFDSHWHSFWTAIPAPRGASLFWIVVGGLLGLTGALVFNALVDEGTVLGYTFGSTIDEWPVMILITIAITALGATLAGWFSTLFDGDRNRTSAPQVPQQVNTDVPAGVN